MMMRRIVGARGVRRGERGFALVAVLGVMTLLMGLGAALHSGTIAETVLRGGHRRATDGFYAAESGINRGMAEYKNIFLSYNVPSGGDFDPRTFTLNSRNVMYQLSAVAGYPKNFILPSGAQFAGLNSIQYSYTATSTSSMTVGDVEAAIGSQFNVDYIPLFQFLAFYQNDLEILPGPTMNLTGPVHTNGTLYLNSNTSCAGSPCVGGSDDRGQLPDHHDRLGHGGGRHLPRPEGRVAVPGHGQHREARRRGQQQRARPPADAVQRDAVVEPAVGVARLDQGEAAAGDGAVARRAGARRRVLGQGGPPDRVDAVLAGRERPLSDPGARHRPERGRRQGREPPDVHESEPGRPHLLQRRARIAGSRTPIRPATRRTSTRTATGRATRPTSRPPTRCTRARGATRSPRPLNSTAAPPSWRTRPSPAAA